MRFVHAVRIYQFGMDFVDKGEMIKAKQVTNWPLVLLLWIVGLAAAMQFAKFSISLFALGEVYEIADTWTAVLLSSVGIMGIVFGATAGILVVRVGIRRALLLALVIGAAASAVQSATPSYSIILMSRLAEGISHLLIVVAAPTAMASLSSDRHRSIVMGIWATFFGVAFAIMGWLGIPLLETSGISALFLAHAALMLSLFCLLWFLMKPVSRAKEKAPNLSLASLLNMHKKIYSSPRTIAPGAAFFWHTMMFVALLTFLPSFANNEASVKLLATTLPLVSIGGSFASGIVAQRFKNPFALLTGAFAGLLPLAALTWVAFGSEWFNLAACALMTGSGFVQGTAFAVIPKLSVTEEGQAHANGAIAQLGNLGATIGTPIFALGIQMLGYSVIPSLVLLISCVAISVVAVVTFKTKGTAPEISSSS